MQFYLVDDKLEELQTINWGCFGGLNRLDEYTPSCCAVSDFQEESWYGGSEEYDHGCDNAEYAGRESYVMLDKRSIHPDLFNDDRLPVIEYLCKRSPWARVFHDDSLELFKTSQVICVKTDGVPCDLAVQALQMVRSIARSDTIVGYFGVDADVPDNHKWAMSYIRGCSNFPYLPEGDDTFLPVSCSVQTYMNLMNSDRRGHAAPDEYSLSFCEGYTTTLAEQWAEGSDEMCGGGMSGLVQLLQEVIRELESTQITGMFQSYPSQLANNWGKFLELSWSKLNANV